MSESAWPEEASRQACDDFDRLLPAAWRVAQRQLAEKGEFWPFAVLIDIEGDLHLVSSPVPSTRDRPSPGEVLAILRQSLHDDSRGIRAVALVLDVHVPELASDCIEVTCEHPGSPAAAVRRPYTRRRFGGRVVYGADVSAPGRATLLG